VDKKLWKEFSRFIRLRDADENGICTCITCGLKREWKKMDCGHGIGRQHWGTRYDEKNNHAQCKKCNGFEGGRMDVYKEQVNKKYGVGTWDLLEAKARSTSKRYGKAEIEILTREYRDKANKLERN
jgi:hypothetical protein